MVLTEPIEEKKLKLNTNLFKKSFTGQHKLGSVETSKSQNFKIDRLLNIYRQHERHHLLNMNNAMVTIGYFFRAVSAVYERAPVPANFPPWAMRYSSRIGVLAKKHSRISLVPAA